MLPLKSSRRKVGRSMKYANTEINMTVERLVEIATLAIQGLLEDDEETAMEYFAETMELTDEEREFFGVPMETEDPEDDEWENE
jgi:cytochrome c-type biogenesis protein CcmH/NrfG